MCVSLLLCSVCGKHAPPEDRVFFPLRLASMAGRPVRAWLMQESPVHGACARHAQEVCPFIKRKNLKPLPFPPGDDYEIVPVRYEKDPGVVKFLAYKFSWGFVRSTIARAL